MTGLMEIAQSHNLAVIEDCAQSTGAIWDGKKVGTIGQVGCFSFYPTKNLGACGDGGAIITNDPAIAVQLRILRDHGSKVKYIHEEIGVNSRLDAIQAAILRIKLPLLDTWNYQRQLLANNYSESLSQVPEIVIPQELPGGVGVWNQYTIRVSGDIRNGASAKYRDWVRERMQEQGVSSMVYYPRPLHLQPVYQNLGYAVGQFPGAERVSHEVISLPMFPELTQEQQAQVISTLKDCLAYTA
jgi:dTDP-4-amino-4,6-dideoxygalactose transaminase